MANFAAILGALSISGSRKSDGTANASGLVYAYLPGTLTTTSLYANATAATIATQPITLDSGGRVPRSNYPDGLFITRPVRLLIQDSAGATVSDSVYVPSTAGAVGVDNDGFSDSTLDDVLTDAFASLGGTDWKYKESGGATERTVKAKFAEIWISVKDFGAVGDGVAIDTTAIQAALNRVKALGGGVCYFPPGTYLIDQALTMSSVTGVTVVGAGMAATIIKSNHATANVFTVTTGTSVSFQDFNTTNTGDSTGASFALTTVNGASFVRVGSDGFGAGNSYRYGIQLTTSSYASVQDCRFIQVSEAAARCIVFNDTISSVIYGGQMSAGIGYAVEFTVGGGQIAMYGTVIDAGSVRFTSGLVSVSTGYSFFGVKGLTLSVGTAAIPVIRYYGGGLLSSSTSSATGAAQTPSLIGGREVILTAASGGAGVVTVNAPAVLPATGDTDSYWDFVFRNAAGGAVTWTMNAIYVLDGATAIPTTDGHTIMVRFRWDGATSELRECSRSDTVT